MYALKIHQKYNLGVFCILFNTPRFRKHLFLHAFLLLLGCKVEAQSVANVLNGKQIDYIRTKTCSNIDYQCLLATKLC